MIQRLCTMLSSHRFRFANERDLQDGIEALFVKHEYDFEREVILTPRDRIDFLIGSVGVEIKVDGSLSAVTRQLWRYAQQPRIETLVLVTTRLQHRRMPAEILGKPLYIVHLSML